LFEAISEGRDLLPQLGRRPALLRRCLLRARGAQIALAVIPAFLLLALPPLLDAVLPKLYPPIETEHKVLGFIRHSRSQANPQLEARRRQILFLGWAGGISVIGALLLASLPVSVAHARQRAERLAEQANSYLSHNPAESALLYNSALALTLDPAQAAELERRRRSAADHARESARRVPANDAVADSELRALRAAETMLEPVRPTGDRSGDSREVGATGRYQLEKELGRGAMGVVYRAFDTVLEREVALKELAQHFSQQSELARRFRQEARLLARLSHPNIVQVYDLVEDRGRLWIAMELVTGGTLSDVMERVGGPLPWGEVAGLGQQIASGLAFAHENGVIHRDVKPINVLLTQGEAPVAKLTDFGLAKHLESTAHTQAGTLLGTARYMSPEQAAGQPTDTRSDIYSLGITLYELLCGRAPFEGEVSTVLAQHISQPPPPVTDFCKTAPESISSLIATMLAKSPDEREPELRGVIETLSSLAHPAAS
jgi:hypothetical protein